MKVTKRGVTVGCLPPPCDFGAPSWFEEWREEQEEGLVLLTESSKRISVLNMPTGAGKSLLNYMYCLITGQRGLILTETKPLQDKYEEDFGSCDKPKCEGQLVDIRGANNYPCPALESGGRYHYLLDKQKKATCDVGPCRLGMPCALRDGGCPYYDQLERARQAQVVSTNYANWLVMGKGLEAGGDRKETLGEFDVLICDEIHGAPEQVSKAMTVELDLSALRDFFGDRLNDPPTGGHLSDWMPWIKHLRGLQQRLAEEATILLRLTKDGGLVEGALLEDVRFLSRLSGELKVLEDLEKDERAEWCVEQVNFGRKSVVALQPVWPGAYTERMLFRGINKVIGTSATVIPETLKHLGLKAGTYDYWEFDSSFPVENRPVYVLPVAFMRYDMTETEKRKWARAIDNIGKAYSSSKGIVHTVSFERARYFTAHTSMQDRVLENTSQNTGRTVRDFKDSTRPLVLVSPSVATGHDFPDEQCRWQVIGKVPFPDRRTEIMKRRLQEDKQYGNYLAMQYIVQAAGRSTRSPDDWSVVIIIDGVFVDWYKRNKQFAPLWFREAVKQVSAIPKMKVHET